VNDPKLLHRGTQVNALWKITSWMRLDAGSGYRAVGGAGGSIGLQLGGR